MSSRARAVLLDLRSRRPDPGVLHRYALAALVAVAAALAIWNAASAPGHIGYDSEQNVHYAHDLVHEWQFGDPNDPSENSYKPPGFFLVAGSVMFVGEELGVPDPRKFVQFMNAFLLVGTLLLVVRLARILFPDRRAVHLLAGGFFLFLPLVPKTAAMFHPATSGTFLTALALVLTARMLADQSFTVRRSLVLLAVLVAGLSVMSAGVWTYAAVVGAFVLAGLGRSVPWRRLAIPLLVLVGITGVLTAPWYVKQTIDRGTPFLSGPSNTRGSFIHDKPLSFYTDLGYPEVFERPIRPSYNNRLFPTAYTETWGDYFGVWAWAAESPPDGEAIRELRQQTWIGLLPTLLGIGGLFALLGVAVAGVIRRRPDRIAPLLPVVLLPLIAWAGFLFYAIAYTSLDGDTLKGTYMLTAAPAWAICFAYAADGLRRLPVVGLPIMAILGGSALLSLPFLAFHDPLFGLL